jgi:hypothetical protein
MRAGLASTMRGYGLGALVMTVAVGLLGPALVATPAMAAPALSWSPPTRIDGGHSLRDVSCASPTFCVAVDGAGNVVTSNDPDGGPSAWKVASVDDDSLQAVSCASSELCVAVSLHGDVVASGDPTGGSSSWTAMNVDGGRLIIGISCPSASLCVAVDYRSRFFVSRDPTGGGAAWKRTQLSEHGFTDVSCRSSSWCAATDYRGRVGVSTDPTGGRNAWKFKQVVPNSRHLPVFSAISCPPAPLCVGTGGERVFVSDHPTGGRREWTKFRPTDERLLDIGCASGFLCAAVGRRGEVVASTDPTAGKDAWERNREAPGNLRAVSCPENSFCVAVGEGGTAIVGETTLTRPPDTKIVASDIESGKGKAKFRFKAEHEAAAGFQCKLKTHAGDISRPKPRFTRCDSPKIYRHLRPGGYRFKVRAVNTYGADPTPSRRHFRITG